MVRDPFPQKEIPELETVLEALEDPDCRTIIRNLEEPMTASEISETCDIPLSTTYRKLDKMTEATLLEEMTEIRSDGRHTTRYRVGFTDVTVSVTESLDLDLEITRPPKAPDERLADLWSEVRKEV